MYGNVLVNLKVWFNGYNFSRINKNLRIKTKFKLYFNQKAETKRAIIIEHV